MLHHGLRGHTDVLDVAHAAHGTRPPGWSMHAAGVKFNYTLFVGQAAEAHGIVIRIVLRPLHYPDGSLECIAAAFEEGICGFRIREPIVRADDNGTFAAFTLGSMTLAGFSQGIGNRGIRCHSGSNRSQN